MPCYRPLTAYQCADGAVVFDERKGDVVRTLTLACAKCIGCRLRYSSDWACRIMHEAQLHAENCYITLTYESLDHYSLHYADFQVFMRELRYRYYPVKKFRYYVAGEYGEAFGRPHWHAIIFGHDFRDWKYLKMSPSGHKLFRSAELESLWSFGYSSVANVTWESAAYCARYVMKKVTGVVAEDWYNFVDVGELRSEKRVPEFCRMSLKPGIGADWVAKYQSDVYPEGKVVVNGRKQVPPRYYDKLFVDGGGDSDAYSLARHVAAMKGAPDNSPERLAVKEIVQEARVKFLKRELNERMV